MIPVNFTLDCISYTNCYLCKQRVYSNIVQEKAHKTQNNQISCYSRFKTIGL